MELKVECGAEEASYLSTTSVKMEDTAGFSDFLAEIQKLLSNSDNLVPSHIINHDHNYYTTIASDSNANEESKNMSLVNFDNVINIAPIEEWSIKTETLSEDCTSTETEGNAGTNVDNVDSHPQIPSGVIDTHKRKGTTVVYLAAVNVRLQSVTDDRRKTMCSPLLETVEGSTLTHPATKPNVCTQCGKRLKSAIELKYHLKNHAVTTYVCPICGRAYTTISNLARHVLTHTGPLTKPHKCKVCGKRFRYPSQLDAHSLVHTGRTLAEHCDVCGRNITKWHLKAHLMTHTGEKPFECKVCRRKFARISQRDRHLKMHTGDKPYSCKICGKKCSRPDNLKSHEMTHAREKSQNCVKTDKKRKSCNVTK